MCSVRGRVLDASDWLCPEKWRATSPQSPARATPSCTLTPQHPSPMPLVSSFTELATEVPAVVGLAGGLLLALMLTISTHLLRYNSLPPGPPSTLLRGTTGLRKELPWRQFAEWGAEYGDLLTVWLGARDPLVVLNGYKAAYDVLEKQSSSSSGRPQVRHVLPWIECCGASCARFAAAPPSHSRFKRVSS